MRRVLSVLIILALSGVCTLGGAWLWLQDRIHAEGPLVQERTVVIESGLGLNRIARRLVDAGVIESDLVFRVHARMSGYAAQLKAGEYAFAAQISTADVLAKIVAHDVVVRFVTVPEGLTTPQIEQLLLDAEGLSGVMPAGIENGTILPETYGFSLGDTRADLVGRMSRAMEGTVAELWDLRAPDLPLDSPEEAVILASIVEKETGVASERPRVAAVFINRLRRGMRLQSDPSVAFGVDPSGPLGRPLRRSDLDTATPFNTYVINGLPPAPICHPGRASLAAVLNPIETDELYFVADGTGGHAFARTLAEHNRNVARWRRIERARQSD
jgi:UPF0755 protein